MILIDRWLGSAKIAAMQPEEEGAFFRLLLLSASSDDCGLPDDDNELAKLSRLGPLWKKKAALSSITRGERIRQCFVAQNGRLYNERALADRAKLEAAIEKKREGGIRSGQVRAANKKARSEEDDANISSSSVEDMFEKSSNTKSTETNLALKRKRNLLAFGERVSSARHPPEAVEWVRLALVDFFAITSTQPPSKTPPDDEICSQIIDIVGVGGLEAFKETLLAKVHRRNLKVASWGFFLQFAQDTQRALGGPQIIDGEAHGDDSQPTA